MITTAIAVRRQWVSSSGEIAGPLVNDIAAEPIVPLAPSMDESTAQRLLKLLGLVSAATLMPLALLLYNVPPLRDTLHWLSPLITACGVPALLVRLLFRRRLTNRAVSGLQTTGIAVGPSGDGDGSQRVFRVA